MELIHYYRLTFNGGLSYVVFDKEANTKKMLSKVISDPVVILSRNSINKYILTKHLIQVEQMLEVTESQKQQAFNYNQGDL